MNSPARAFDFDPEPEDTNDLEVSLAEPVIAGPIRTAMTDPLFRYVGLGFASLFGILLLAAFLTF